MNGETFVGLLAAMVPLLPGTPAAAVDAKVIPGRGVSARVVDQAGKPLAGVVVFAAEASKVVGMALSDEAGAVELPRPRPRYNFGLMSPALRLAGVTPRGPRRFDLIAAPLPPAPAGDGSDPHLANITAQ